MLEGPLLPHRQPTPFGPLAGHLDGAGACYVSESGDARDLTGNSTAQLRLFDSLVEHAVPDGSDLLQLVFSACKFLDLTLVLQTEDFQMCAVDAPSPFRWRLAAYQPGPNVTVTNGCSSPTQSTPSTRPIRGSRRQSWTALATCCRTRAVPAARIHPARQTPATGSRAGQLRLKKASLRRHVDPFSRLAVSARFTSSTNFSAALASRHTRRSTCPARELIMLPSSGH